MQEVSAMPENDFACEDIRIFEMFPAGKMVSPCHMVYGTVCCKTFTVRKSVAC